MLAEFSVANFRSFADRQTLSLVAGPDRAHPGHLYATEGGNRLLKSAAIFGKNASGKSNLIAALRTMQQLVETSATRLNAGDAMPGIVPFRLDPELRKCPSSFRVLIIIDGMDYEYGFEATKKEVTKEWLLKSGKKTVFSREHEIYKFGDALSEAGPAIATKTRSNALLLSVGAQFNNEVLTTVYTWFKDHFSVHDMTSSPIQLLVMRTAELIRKDDKLREQLLTLVSDADIGIAEITISEKKTDEAEIPEEIRAMFTEVGIKTLLSDRNQIHLYAMHRPSSGKGEHIAFNFLSDESHGTLRVFAIAGPILNAIENGALIVIDEFDCSMHAHLAEGLIRYFTGETAGSSGAQLVIATHNPSLFNGKLFRRDEIWMVDKYDTGRSQLGSLYDSDNAPRSDAAFYRSYSSGVLGGVPALGPSLDRPESKHTSSE